MTVLAYTDGAARGNPGEAGIGVVMRDESGETLYSFGGYLGTSTNNVAEYRALIAGLAAATRHGADPLTVCMDSELVVRQMTGEYRVKHAGLKPLHAEAARAAARLASVRFTAVRREENARADQLVNDTLDREMDTSSESPR